MALFRKRTKFEPPAHAIRLLCRSTDEHIKSLIGLDRRDAEFARKIGAPESYSEGAAYLYYRRADQMIDWLLIQKKRPPDFLDSKVIHGREFRAVLRGIHDRVEALATKENFTEQRLIELRLKMGWRE